MPFKIIFTYQAQKRFLICIGLVIFVLSFGAVFVTKAPGVLRVILSTFLLLSFASFIPRYSKWKPLTFFCAIIIFPLYRFITPDVAFFIDSPIPAIMPGKSKKAIDIISYHFNSVQETIVRFGQSFFQKIWPQTSEFLIALILALTIWWTWPKIRQISINHAGNDHFQWLEFVLVQLPNRLALYIRGEGSMALTMIGLWTLAWHLLGFRYFLLLGLFSGIGYWTPYLGNVLASLIALFFAGEIRTLPMQLVAIILASALFWLAKYFIWETVLSNSRPSVPTGVVLILLLSGFAIGGFWGFFFAIPVFSISLLITQVVDEASPLFASPKQHLTDSRQT